MKLVITSQQYSLQWDGTYYFALVDYPKIKDFELEKIAIFVAFEKLHNRVTEICCKDDNIIVSIKDYLSKHTFTYPFTPSGNEVGGTYNCRGNYVYSDFLSHTCTLEVAKSIFKSGALLSAVRAFGQSANQIAKSSRNVAGDPPDYFEYVMLGWSNTTSGYQLAMERLLGRMPNDLELNKKFIPGISFHFKYNEIINCDGYVFDGYHAAKVKDTISLKQLHSCIIPSHYKPLFEDIIPEELSPKVHYLHYEKDGLENWCDKVYHYLCHHHESKNN